MKLFVTPTLPNNNKSPLMIMIDYDQDSEGNCKKMYCESHNRGTSFDVPDDLGHAILVKYKQFVRSSPWPDKGTPTKNKMVETAGKTA